MWRPSSSLSKGATPSSWRILSDTGDLPLCRDIVGNRLAHGRKAMATKADVIALAHFTPETAKQSAKDGAHPTCTQAVCRRTSSLLRTCVGGASASQTADSHLCHTSAAVKAEPDIYHTSGIARTVVGSLGVPRAFLRRAFHRAG